MCWDGCCDFSTKLLQKYLNTFVFDCLYLKYIPDPDTNIYICNFVFRVFVFQCI